MNNLHKAVAAVILSAILTVCASLSKAAPEDEDGGPDLTAQKNENGGVDLTAKPVILTVDGLNFRTFGCGKEIYEGRSQISIPAAYTLRDLNRDTCKVVDMVAGFLFRDRDANETEYLYKDLKKICGAGACGEFFGSGFYWNGDERQSRPVVDDLKKDIKLAAAYASSKKRPLIMVVHSWGCMLTVEALGEIESEGGGVQVAKLVTLGNPIGGFNLSHPFGGLKYKAAVRALITDQNFFMEPHMLRSVGKWVNYWASRDWVSSELHIHDQDIKNIQIDADPKYNEAAEVVRHMISGYLNLDLQGPEQQEKLEEAKADIEKIGFGPGPTGVWHSIYMEGGGKISLPSISQTPLDVGTYPMMEKELSSI
ncbi:MAG: hypothetical protein NTX59_05310 [Elusimicrobia bacterium]|nr:hypothetical protein [Elusimicrobiota bacterium]